MRKGRKARERRTTIERGRDGDCGMAKVEVYIPRLRTRNEIENESIYVCVCMR